MPTKVYTLDELRSWTPEKLYKLYENAITHPGGEYILRLIEDNGLPLPSAWMTNYSPTFLKIKEIVWFDEGKSAALEATRKGVPALCGVDLLLREKMGAEYHAKDKGTLSAGGVVADVMRHMGYKESGKGTCPQGCIAKTGIVWVPLSK